MASIKFSKNWNYKLNCDYFTTIRLFTQEKYNYYNEIQSKKENIDVILNGEKIFTGKIVSIYIYPLHDIDSYTLMVDSGLTPIEFEKLMFKMYSKKPEWCGSCSLMLIICIKKNE